MSPLTFEEFFQAATGKAPYGYQARLARDGLPAVLRAPTGSGKTGVILAWLWRRRHGPDPRATPRRLVYALPQRTLVEQVADQVRTWLANLDLTDRVALHIVMGGEGRTQQAWRQDPHRPAVVVGTVDSLVSKALNRGYGISRSLYPVDFALVTNGAHWIIDEVQLAPESTTTLRQLAAFISRHGTAEPFGLTCMSATVPDRLLATVDNPTVAEAAGIRPEDRVGELVRRLDATRTIRRLPAEAGDPAPVAAAVRQRHRPGTLTLVVVNTVDAARRLHAALRGTRARRILLHSRFRAVDRETLVREVTEPLPAAGRIVVATQVVEAGLDLDAAVLVTEAAPWPSVVQRAGRCNRAGQVPDAELWWLPPAKPPPYEPADIDSAVAALAALEGQPRTGEQLQVEPVEVTEPQVAVLRRPDLLDLFDTAPDLSGTDLDVAPYVRDNEALDVQLAWAVWEPGPGGAPPPAAKAPEQRWRCRVPLGELRALARRGGVWRFDQAAERWTKVDSAHPARPGEVLVMAAADGGYDPATGLDPAVARPVPGCPQLESRPDPRTGTAPATGAEDGFGQDDGSLAQRDWLSLEQHSEDVRDQARSLLQVIAPDLPPGVARAVEIAGYVHDAGKCHPTWQDALCALATEAQQERVAAGRPWAKSDNDGRLDFGPDTPSFRHELVSMLLLEGPLRPLLAGIDDPDLVRYLVLAHHGKLRVQVRAPEETDQKRLLGLTQDAQMAMPAMLGQPPGTATIDLGQFQLGSERSWTRTALALRDRYGPFRLAYLETLVRMADWRASTPGEPLATEEEIR